MTRKERNAEVCRLAANLGLDARADMRDCNSWLIHDISGEYRGLLLYNQRSGTWKAMGGRLSKAYFGALGGMLNLLACQNSPVGKPLIEIL